VCVYIYVCIFKQNMQNNIWISKISKIEMWNIQTEYIYIHVGNVLHYIFIYIYIALQYIHVIYVFNINWNVVNILAARLGTA
jgi:hypothetical protein